MPRRSPDQGRRLPIVVSTVTITLEGDKGSRTRYWALLAVLVALDIYDDQELPYNIVVRDTATDEVVWREGPYEGPTAEGFSKEIAAAIEQHGLSEFLYRKEHRWRTD